MQILRALEILANFKKYKHLNVLNIHEINL